MGRFTKRIKKIVEASLADLKYNIQHCKRVSCLDAEMEFARLRMFCHMLDKGMNNPQFEKGHSLQIFEGAKKLYEKLQKSYDGDSAFAWTNAILDRFAEAQKTGYVSAEPVHQEVYGDGERELHEKFIRSRISCRNFKPETIPEEILRQMVSLAVDAPNGCCRQTVRYHITQNPEIIETVVPCVAGITNFSKIPCLVCVAAESSYYDIEDKNLQYVDAALSAENFILAARLHNIYGTMCNFFRASEEQRAICKNKMGVKDSENIVMFIALGYPIALPEKPIRRNVDTFLSIER